MDPGNGVQIAPVGSGKSENMLSIIPSFKEAILFISLVGLLLLIAVLYHNNNIQVIVNNISRCMRDNAIKASNNGIFTVTLVNRNKVPLYDITYDTGKKIFYTKCRLPTGNVANNIPIQFPAYDFIQKGTNPALQTFPECYGDKDYTSNGGPFTFIGYGPLLDFIESNGTLTYMFDDNNGVTDNSQRCQINAANTGSIVFSAPTSITATGVTFNFNWTGYVSGKYTVYKAGSGSGTGSDSTDTPVANYTAVPINSNQTSVIVSGLTAATSYYIVIITDANGYYGPGALYGGKDTDATNNGYSQATTTATPAAS
jgi:hypothetical protein